MATLTITDLARRYLEKIPGAVSGSGGHNQTFLAACALVKGFDLSVDEARPLLTEYNLKCDPPWTAAELEYKLKSADRTKDERTRGWLRLEIGGNGHQQPAPRSEPPKPEPKPEFMGGKLAAFAARWREYVTTAWLADRSPSETFELPPDRFLAALYHEGEHVVIFTKDKSQGQALWPDEKIPMEGPRGVWFLSQPVDGQYHPNPRVVDSEGKPKPSRRSEESVTAWRYMVIESDEAPARDWLAALVQLPLRIAAIYTSGKRSIHALVRIDAPSKHEWDNTMKLMRPILVTLGADPKAMTAVRLTRLPGCRRLEAARGCTATGLQKLLYLNPEPDAEPICTLAVKRDVLAYPISIAEAAMKWTPAQVFDDPEFQEAARMLEWYQSAPPASKILERIKEWRSGANASTPPASTPATSMDAGGRRSQN